MIGMMYLVLTAMLALNVSTEVLKSFVTVNEAMETTNKNYATRNEAVYDIFQRAYLANESKVAEQWEKARQIKARSKEIYDFIQETKYELIAITEKITVDEARNLNPRDIKSQDNYDDPTRYFMGGDIEKNGKAYELHAKIDEYREFLETMLGNDSSKVSLEALETDTEYKNPDGQVVSWETYYFYHSIIMADLTILNRFLTSILNAESDVVSQLYSSVSEDDFKFDTISARVVPTSTNVFVGSDFEADIFVAAFDSKSKISATINGQQYEGEGGSIRYKAPTSSTGEKTFAGTINVPGSFGVKSYPFEFTYNVSEPVATVSADAMNVFYAGVDNPVTVIAGGIPDKDTRVEITNGTLTKNGPGTYIARVPKPGPIVEIKVYAKDGANKERLMGVKKFRTKRVPDPVPCINGHEPGERTISKGLLTAAGGLVVKMKDFDFDLPNLKVVSFKVQIFRNQELTPTMNSNGNRFSDDMLDYFKNCRSGNKVFITDIMVRMPEGNRNVGDMTLTIK